LLKSSTTTCPCQCCRRRRPRLAKAHSSLLEWVDVAVAVPSSSSSLSCPVVKNIKISPCRDWWRKSFIGHVIVL
jgi:hypothetical protein